MNPTSLKTFAFTLNLCLAFLLTLSTLTAQYTPDEYLERGKQLHQQGNLAKAVEHYSYAIQLRSDCASCFYNRGLAFLEMTKYRKSRADFDQVLKINPADTDAYEQRGGIHYMLGDYEKSISDFTFVLLAKPKANIYINRGMAFLELVKYNDALRDLENAMAIDKEDSEIYRVIGDIYFAKGDSEQAIEYYGMALTKNPNDERALNNRGNTYQQMGMEALALADYNHAIDVFQNSHTYTNRAKYWLKQGAYDKALKDCRKASQLDYNNAEAYYCIGQVENAQGNAASALNNFNKAIAVNDNRADFYNGRGLALFKLNELEDALSDFQQAVTIDPSDAAAKDRILDCHEKIGHQSIASQNSDEQSEEIFVSRGLPQSYNTSSNNSRVTEQQPVKKETTNSKSSKKQNTQAHQVSPQSKAQKYIELGDFYFESKDYTEAIQHYESAIWHDKYSKTVYLKKAQCLVALQQEADAILALDQHIKLHPNEADAYYQRGSLRFRTGNIFGAKEDYDLGLTLNRTHPKLLKGRAQWNAHKGYYLKAIDDYSILIQNEPQAFNYYQRGLMWFKLKTYNKALKDYTEAILKSDVEKSDYFLARGITYQFNNAPDLAIYDLDKAISLSPRLSKAYMYRAAAKSNLGDQGGTCSDYKTALSLGYKATDKINFVSHCK